MTWMRAVSRDSQGRDLLLALLSKIVCSCLPRSLESAHFLCDVAERRHPWDFGSGFLPGPRHRGLCNSSYPRPLHHGIPTHTPQPFLASMPCMLPKFLLVSTCCCYLPEKAGDKLIRASE